MTRRTKIVATLGPASEAPDVLRALILAGVDVVRVNLSHASLDELAAQVDAVRDTVAMSGRPVAVLADLPGPKVRCGDFGDDGAYFTTGSHVTLIPGEGASDAHRITVDHPPLLDDLEPGATVIVGDGVITLIVTESGRDAAHATVVTGGHAVGRPGFHIPSERLQLSTPTPRDVELLEGIRNRRLDVDYVAVSFVRTSADVDAARRIIGANGPKIIAKIETASAVQDLGHILDVADALMIARGDLGITMPLETVPFVQKSIIRQAIAAGVPVITATQMLESMITAPAPTRAEVSDIANAVLDGTDALMLSGETAIGRDPPLVVETMARIAAEADANADDWRTPGLFWRHDASGEDAARAIDAVTHAAWQAARDLGAAAILCSTRTGRTARALARYRPSAPIIALSPDDATVRQLSLVWGVRSRPVPLYMSTDEMVRVAVDAAADAGDIHPGDTVVVLAGSAASTGRRTDVLQVVRVS